MTPYSYCKVLATNALGLQQSGSDETDKDTDVRRTFRNGWTNLNVILWLHLIWASVEGGLFIVRKFKQLGKFKHDACQGYADPHSQHYIGGRVQCDELFIFVRGLLFIWEECACLIRRGWAVYRAQAQTVRSSSNMEFDFCGQALEDQLFQLV